MIKLEPLSNDNLMDVYEDSLLRPVLTVPPIGRKFGVVMYEEGAVIGAATGYYEGEYAVLQLQLLHGDKQVFEYEDIMVRSEMHFTELAGAKRLLIENKYLGGLHIPFTSEPDAEASAIIGNAAGWTCIDSSEFFKRGGGCGH